MNIHLANRNHLRHKEPNHHSVNSQWVEILRRMTMKYLQRKMIFLDIQVFVTQ